MYPLPIKQLITAFERLPSVGPRTAERFVFALLRSGKKEVGELARSLVRLANTVKSCQTCWTFSDTDPCLICKNPKRDQETLCIVKSPQDIEVIERTSLFRGRYHVLRGVIEADDEESLAKLTLPHLLSRIKTEEIKEVILALNPDLPGETTMMLLQKKISALATDVALSRLAKGLPLGSDIQYADEMTLESALKHRVQIK